MKTGDNKRFIRFWFEVNNKNIKFDAQSIKDAENTVKKWFPYNKGGKFRKWYGNEEYVVNYKNQGFEIFNNAKEDKRNVQNYPDDMKFSPSISWSLVTSSKPSFRYKQFNLSDIAGMSLYKIYDNLEYYLGFCNSNISYSLLKVLAPTINFQSGDVGRLPIIYDKFNSQKIKIYLFLIKIIILIIRILYIYFKN